MSNSISLNNSKGQLIIEAILIMVVLVGLMGLTVRFFRDEEVLVKLVRGPWVRLSGLIQNGVWATPQKGAAIHPSALNRHVSVKGEKWE